MSGGDVRRMRKRCAELFQQQNGLCHWCRQAMTPPSGRGPSDGRLTESACTFDHLYATNDPRRKSASDLDNAVAACFRCNNDRSRDQTYAPMHLFEVPAVAEGPFAKLKTLLEAAE